MMSFSQASTQAVAAMRACTAVPTTSGSTPPFTASGCLVRDCQCFINEAFQIGRDLLLAGRRGEWGADATNPAFPSDSSLVLLRAGEPIFDRYRKKAVMMLLRPSALPNDDAASAREEGETNSLSFVMFVGNRKPDLSGTDELWAVEDGLMDNLRAAQNIHFYCVLPLADGVNYVNVVMGRALGPGETPLALMSPSTWHRRAVLQASPVSYSWVRIHSGTFHGSIVSRAPASCVHITRSLCVFFGSAMPERRTESKEEGKKAEEEEEEGQPEQNSPPQPPLAAILCPFVNGGVVWRRVLPQDSYFYPFAVESRWDPSECKLTSAFDALLALEQPPSSASSSSSSSSAGKEDQSTGAAVDVDWLFNSAIPRAAIATATKPIRVTSYLSSNSARFYREKVFAHVAAETGLPLEWVAPSFDQAPMDALLLSSPSSSSECDVAFMCGMMVARAMKHKAAGFAVLAAPMVKVADEVLPAYQCMLVVRKEILVGAAGKIEQQEDVFSGGSAPLRGKRLVINERCSWSGCRALELALKEEATDQSLETFFGGVTTTGSHIASLDALVQGTADVASIDSDVLARHGGDKFLEQHGLVALKNSPLSRRLWPAPPCVANCRRLSPWVVTAISQALLRAPPAVFDGEEEEGGGGFVGFQRVTNACYRPMESVLED